MANSFLYNVVDELSLLAFYFIVIVVYIINLIFVNENE